MPTANEQLRDAVLRHQVALARYSSGEVRKILELLDATNADLEALLVRRLAAIADGRVRSAAVTERLKKLLDNIRTMRLAAYREAGKALTADLIDLGRYEAEFGARMIQAAAPVELILGTTATIEQVAAIVRSKPFQGLILRDWVADLADQELRAVERAVNIGMAEGEGIPGIVRRIVGSKRAGIRGVLDISRRNAETWVRTAVSHTANETRDALYADNADILNGVAVLVTLDNRTCPICIPKDGLKYSLPDYKPVGHGVPWGAGPGRYHPQDRCTSLPWMKDWKELGIDLDEAPETTRASMNGQVPASTTYQQWLKGQPAAVQNEVLGVKRAQAMRSGALKWDEMFTPSGEFRSLSAMKAAETVSRIDQFPKGPRTFYHVVGQNYEQGMPLKSWNRLLADGENPGEWKWGEAKQGADGDVVSLYRTMDQAVDHIDEFGGSRVVRVVVPDGVDILKVDEGFDAVRGIVPEGWIKDYYDGRTIKPLIYERRSDLIGKGYSWSPDEGWIRPGVKPKARKAVPSPARAAAQTGVPKAKQVELPAPSIAGAEVSRVQFPPGSYWRIDGGRAGSWATFDAEGNVVKVATGPWAPSTEQVEEWARRLRR